MDGSLLGSKSDVRTVVSPPCIPSLCIQKLHVENENNGNGNNTHHKSQEIVDASLACGGNVITPEDEFTPGGHANGLEGQSSGTVAVSEQGELIDSEPEEIRPCQASSHPLLLHAKDQKRLQKCATFSCSAELQQSSSESLAYKRSTSLPTSAKPVSAMKGSRVKNGACPTVELRVKWALEVYDPPLTSVSHTVQSHQQHRKAKKKENRKQKNKGKSPRGGANERKHRRSSNGNASVALDARPQNVDGAALCDAREVNTKPLEYAMSRQESKCGSSSFLMEAVGKMHFPTAEAS